MSAPVKKPEKSRRRNRRRYARLIALSKLSLSVERLWPCLWQPAAVVAAIAGIGFTGLLTILPLWLHTLVILVMAGVLCFISSRAFSTFQMPDHEAVIAWIEHRNLAQNRPLAAFRDSLSSDPSKILEHRLWQEHRKRISRQARQLHIPRPRLELAAHDPFALRSVAMLILLIGITVGWNDPGARLYSSLIPKAGWQGPVVQIDTWINPPGYTGHNPFHLSADQNGPKPNPATGDNASHPVPVGSSILVQVASDHKPALRAGNRTITFETLGEDGYRADTLAEASDTTLAETDIAISIPGISEVRWPVQFIDDLPPAPDFNNPPEAVSRGRLSISFSARDDFGLENINLVVHNTALSDDRSKENLFRVNLPLPQAGALSINSVAVKDLSEHEWSGLPVVVSLEAHDAIGQIGRSGTLQIVLPERSFNHPVAKKLVEYRKNLWLPEETTIPGVIRGLGALSLRPADFNHDMIAFLAMRVASARLRYLGNDDVSSVRKLLWETALRIEDGEFAVAGRELTDAHEQLMEALNNGAYGGHIEHLLNALREALERFMAALSEQLTRKGLDSITDLPGMAFMDNADILEMLEDARELARTGSVEAAQQVLEQLRAMLESVENAMNEGVPVEQYNATREMLQKMFDLTQDQESLLDDTFRQVRKGNDPRTQSGGDNDQQQQSGNRYERHADTQERIRQSLRKLLPDLFRMSGSMPGPAIEAERSMQGSSRSLQAGKGDDSIAHQSDALDALRRMSERLAEQMAQQLQGIPGGQAGAQGLIPGGQSDPFGRAGNGSLSSRMDDGTVKIPTEFEILRAQEIFDELRRRSNDRHRPALERHYIERLLRPF